MGPGRGADHAPAGRFLSARCRGCAGIGLAAAVIIALGGCAGQHVLRDFGSDGCSVFVDGDASDPAPWSDCCVAHDLAYWRGGTAAERRHADEALRHCVVARSGRPALAHLMYRGVRIGGLPLWPTPFRWGFGWGYGRGYAPLTAAEQEQVDARLAARESGGSGKAPAPR